MRKMIAFSLHKPLKSLLAIALIATLSACDDEGTECVAANDFGNTQIKTVELKASDKKYYDWVDTGVKTTTNQPLTISTKGVMYFCKNYKLVDVSALQQSWTDTGIAIHSATSTKPGDILHMAVGAPNVISTVAGTQDNKVLVNTTDGRPLVSTRFCDADEPQQGCWHAGGQLLRAMIGFSNQFSVKDGYLGNPTTDGNLLLRIADGNYADNEGGYQVHVTQRFCPAMDGGVAETKLNTGKIEATISLDKPKRTAPGSPITITQGHFKGAAPASGTLWVKVVNDETGGNIKVENYAGSYYLNIEAVTITNTISDLIMKIVNPLKDTLLDVTKVIFSVIASDNTFIWTVRAALILYIVLYALFFTIGLTEFTQKDLIIRVFKISLVLILISRQSWTFFYEYIFSFYWDGMTYLIHAGTGNMGNENETFLFLDKTLGIFVKDATWKKLAGLIVAPPMGIIYLIVIFIGLWTYLIAILEAIISYLIAFIALALMITIAPILLVCILFSTTKPLFDSWLELMLHLALQPVFLFCGLMLLNEFMVIALYGALSFDVCFQESFKIFVKLGDSTKLDLGTISAWSPSGLGVEEMWDPTLGFTSIIMFLIFSKLIKEFTSITPQIVSTLITKRAAFTESLGLSGYGSPGGHAFTQLKEKAKGVVGMDKESVERRAEKRREQPNTTPRK